MLAILIAIGLLIPKQTPTPREAGFEAVFRALRAEFPESLLSVPNRPLSYLRNPPPFTGSDSLTVDPRWLTEMEQQGVIALSCIPPRNFGGCPRPDSLAGRTFIDVQLWPIEHGAADCMTVTVTLSLPPYQPGVADLEKREYALIRDPDGRWRVASYEITGVS